MTNKPVEATKRIAVIRVRGAVGRTITMKKTLNLLRLNKTNHCVIVDDRPTYKGMLQKTKDLVTWGELTHESLRDLLLKRGRLVGDQKITEEYIKKNTSYASLDEFIKKFLNFEANLTDIKGLKPVFRLHPPIKGYPRRGVKYPYTLGGALGYRGTEINQLITKMA
ncbi:MAG: 50S ribosomal protein L30 [Candidatus Hodarchaeales archaeon]|jgi:large subunit ribosomal protein L30